MRSEYDQRVWQSSNTLGNLSKHKRWRIKRIFDLIMGTCGKDEYSTKEIAGVLDSILDAKKTKQYRNIHTVYYITRD